MFLETKLDHNATTSDATSGFPSQVITNPKGPSMMAVTSHLLLFHSLSFLPLLQLHCLTLCSLNALGSPYLRAFPHAVPFTNNSFPPGIYRKRPPIQNSVLCTAPLLSISASFLTVFLSSLYAYLFIINLP